jgi:hypothetical protein
MMFATTPSDFIQPPTHRKVSPTYAVAHAIADVTKLDFDLNQGRLLREAKMLLKKGDAATVSATLHEYYQANAWWYKTDWRGRKGQAPAPQHIRETWGQWVTATAAPRGSYLYEL